MNILRKQLIYKGRSLLNSSKFSPISSNVSYYNSLKFFSSFNGQDTLTESSSIIDSQRFISDNKIFVRSFNNEELQKPIFDFKSINLPKIIQEKITDFDLQKLTPIQAQSIPILLDEKDLIGIAQTGSGKTLAYLLPAFKKLFPIHRDYYSSTVRNPPRALILAPTRELAQQIFSVVRQFRIYKAICLYGGSDRRKQIQYLQNNDPLFVISTPGRLNDLIDAGSIQMNEIQYLVIDEADRMLDMGFEPQIARIISKCPPNSQRQTMMFSATWPEEVQSLVGKYLKEDHAFLSIGGTDLKANMNIKQHIHVCRPNDRQNLLFDILKDMKQNSNPQKIIIFVNTKFWCDRLSEFISRKLGLNAEPLHGNLSQRKRENTLSDFRSGRTQIICATNVAARGLDIDDVGVVINYDLPDDVETYIHRIGRTGRGEKGGESHSFFIDPQKSNLARGLIKVLKESGNEVSRELQNVSHFEKRSNSSRRSSRSSMF